MFESLRLSNISRQQRGLLRKPSSTRPTIWIVEEEGTNAIVKDFSSNGFLFRNIIGRFLVWREYKAYRKLRGLKGVPALYRKIGGLALVIEKIAGKNIELIENKTDLTEDFFQDLQTLVRNIHARGLAHCDLKRAPNIILGDDGKPFIVDWSASISRREFNFFPLNRIYQKFLQDDLNALIKIRLRHCPESVSPEEKLRYSRRNQAEKFIRAIRDKARNLLQKIA